MLAELRLDLSFVWIAQLSVRIIYILLLFTRTVYIHLYNYTVYDIEFVCVNVRRLNLLTSRQIDLIPKVELLVTSF